MLELEGRREKMQLKERFGGGDVNVTPWFIVLSYHRQACIRSFSSFFFFKGGGDDAIMAASSAKSLQGLIQIN